MFQFSMFFGERERERVGGGGGGSHPPTVEMEMILSEMELIGAVVWTLLKGKSPVRKS